MNAGKSSPRPGIFSRRSRQPLLMPDLFDQLYAIATQEQYAGPPDLDDPEAPGHALAFAACYPEEGVTTMAINTAMALGRDESKAVLLVDTNLRAPELHLNLGLERGPGLAEIVLDDLDSSQVTGRPPDLGVDVLQAGRRITSLMPFFTSRAFREWLDEARRRYDFIIMDTASLQHAPEALVLARHADALVLVIEAERTKWEHAAEIKKRITSGGINLSGVILNKKRQYIPEFVYRLLCA